MPSGISYTPGALTPPPMVTSAVPGACADPACRNQAGPYRALAADELCGGKLVMVHEGGYSESYVPYCGLAVLEEMSGVRTSIEDLWAPLMANWGQQALQPHQAEAIARAAQQIENLPSR